MSKARFLVCGLFMISFCAVKASDTDLDTSPLSQKYFCSKEQEQDDLPLFILDEHDDFYRRRKHRRREDDSLLQRQPRVYKIAPKAVRPISSLEIEQAKKIFFGQHKKLITAFLKSFKNEEKKEKKETTFVFPAGQDICISYECFFSFENKLSLKKTYTNEQLDQWSCQSVDHEGIEFIAHPKEAVSTPLSLPGAAKDQVSSSLDHAVHRMKISER
jgi:hypothetical protein